MHLSAEEFKKQRLFLAPMAGYSNLPFRRLCHGGGVDFNTTELVSARGIVYNGLEPSLRYLLIDEDTEGPAAIQLFGCDADDFYIAVQKILDNPTLSRCSAIDINMGCPVKKVCQTGAGAALMQKPEQAVKIVQKLQPLCAGAGKYLTCKFRKGYLQEENTAAEFALALAEAGVDRICIHARTAKQMYAGKADWAVFATVKNKLLTHGFGYLPLIANGDIKSAADCRTIQDMAEVSGFMIGRAACGNPYIFAEIKNPEFKVTAERKIEDLQTCYLQMTEMLGEITAGKEFRSMIMPWIKGYAHSTAYRQLCGKLTYKSEWLNFFPTLLDLFI